MPAQPINAELGSVPEAAERYGVSVSTIRRRIADGTLTAYRLGPRLLRVDFTEADDQFLRRVELGEGAE